MSNQKNTSRRRRKAQATKIDQARRRTRQRPKDDNAWHDLGRTLTEDNQLDKALEAFSKAAELSPATAAHYEWLGYVAYLSQDSHTALQYLSSAQKQHSDSLFALEILTRIHLERASYTLALDHARRAETLAPENPAVRALLGQALYQTQHYDEAISVFERLIDQEPKNYSHWNNLGLLYNDLASPGEAVRCYRRACELNAQDPLPFSNWLIALHYDPATGRDALSNLAREWQSRFAPKPSPGRPELTNHRSDKRLRLGMFSDGFRQHPVGTMTVRCLENLSGAEFELFAYSSNETEDALSQRLRQRFDHWQAVNHFSDDAFAQQIRDDNIDILFDLTGHNTGSRMRVMTLRPAPLIIKWVGGLINTTGVEAIDYLVSDPVETPAGEDSFYSEKLIRMPGDYIVFEPPADLPEVDDLPASKNKFITLGCFNNPTKINDVTLGEWARIMHALPGSKLMLKGKPYAQTALCERLYRTLEDLGIERDRLIIDGPGSNREMLEAYNRVDIALDSWPYSGGLTTCEAFIMGVPVVTLPGPTFAGRHSATHLINAGMPELVTDSWDAYRARVIELAGDLDNLATIRRLLRGTLLNSPVCDGPAFAEHFAKALRAIWQRACMDRAPAALSFDDNGQPWFDGDDEPIALQRPTPAPSETDFEWQFQGTVIAIDSGASLIEQPFFEPLLELGALDVVVFDPASRARTLPTVQRASVHYYANTGLGDGRTATLYACLDARYSSTLVPIQQPTLRQNIAQARQVLANLSVPTIQLDRIEGLDTIDWLVLDDLNDSDAILNHGQNALRDTLLLQARVTFQTTHERQPNLAELQHWASRHGFRFYRLHDAKHDALYGDGQETGLTPSTLVAADALFLPDQERMATLDDNQRMKLAFILHTVFSIRDLPHALIADVHAEAAARYLANVGRTEDAGGNVAYSLSIPDAPHMTVDERRLFADALQRAKRYFEFGSGGSTVWAARRNRVVHGVDSDAQWVTALNARLGENCRIVHVDIGPTGAWGYPKSNAHRHNYPRYSRAIFDHEEAFDLILVDGRFRVASVISAIQHTLTRAPNAEKTRLFIHDFWNRPEYHRVLQFLDSVENADSAGLFRIKAEVNEKALSDVWSMYAETVD